MSLLMSLNVILIVGNKFWKMQPLINRISTGDWRLLMILSRTPQVIEWSSSEIKAIGENCRKSTNKRMNRFEACLANCLKVDCNNITIYYIVPAFSPLQTTSVWTYWQPNTFTFISSDNHSFRADRNKCQKLCGKNWKFLNL